jgi:hypothetical protein
VSRWRWPILIALYLASRLVALTALPMFLDERIHLRWAYWIAQGRRLRLPFISGRGLSVYLLAAFAPESRDPLLAGRLLTVAIGLVAMVGCQHLAERASGDRRIADLAALFYVACPFTLFHDRMVLTDSFLAAFTALTLALALGLAGAPTLAGGAALGLAIGLGVASKTTGLVLFAVPALAVVLAGRERRRTAGPLAVAYAVGAAIAAYPLWLFFRKTDELSGALGVRDNESSFAGNAGANLRLALDWLWTYWTPTLAVLGMAGLVFALSRPDRRRAALLLAIMALGPTLAFVAVSEIWYPRYLLFTTIPLLPLAAMGFAAVVDAVRTRLPLGRGSAAVITIVLLAVVLVPALAFDLALWRDPARAPFPALDRFQYVTGWPSGYGSRESMAFLGEERARNPPGLLLVTPGPSTTASAVRLLSGGDPAVEVRYVDPATVDDVRALAARESPRAVYVIVSRAENVRLPEAWSPALTPAFSSFKPDGAAADEIYRACAGATCS